MESYYINVGVRKQAQDGKTHRFKLFRNDLDLPLCPVRALLRWVAACSGKLLGGRLFLRVSSGVRGVHFDEPMVNII